MDTSTPAFRPPVRWAMSLALGCFLIYVLNVLIGRAAVTFHWAVPRLGDVAEFLVVLAAVTFFVVALIADEVTSETAAD